MTRVDVPTLRCDRCSYQTQSLEEMGKFITLERHHMDGTDKWDLCPPCAFKFKEWVSQIGSITQEERSNHEPNQ